MIEATFTIEGRAIPGLEKFAGEDLLIPIPVARLPLGVGRSAAVWRDGIATYPSDATAEEVAEVSDAWKGLVERFSSIKTDWVDGRTRGPIAKAFAKVSSSFETVQQVLAEFYVSVESMTFPTLPRLLIVGDIVQSVASVSEEWFEVNEAEASVAAYQMVVYGAALASKFEDKKQWRMHEEVLEQQQEAWSRDGKWSSSGSDGK